ncbi:NVEALA domain-containing protein [Viscerimonas tarda]
MKKKIIGGLAILAIAAVTVLNVNLSSQKELLSDISLANVEALAQGEWGGWDNFWQGQGFYKDEREERRQCPSSESYGAFLGITYDGMTIGASGSYTQENPSSREEIICPTGSDNCTAVPC